MRFLKRMQVSVCILLCHKLTYSEDLVISFVNVTTGRQRLVNIIKTIDSGDRTRTKTHFYTSGCNTSFVVGCVHREDLMAAIALAQKVINKRETLLSKVNLLLLCLNDQ